MEHHTGIEASLQRSSLCVLDVDGKVVREVKVASEPEALTVSYAASRCRSPVSAWKQALCPSEISSELHVRFVCCRNPHTDEQRTAEAAIFRPARRCSMPRTNDRCRQ